RLDADRRRGRHGHLRLLVARAVGDERAERPRPRLARAGGGGEQRRRGEAAGGLTRASRMGRHRSVAPTLRGEATPMTRPLRFGVTLPQIKRSWDEARAVAALADELGYDSLWVCDHLLGVPAPNLPILEAWSLLAAVAGATRRARLGTLVTPPF